MVSTRHRVKRRVKHLHKKRNVKKQSVKKHRRRKHSTRRVVKHKQTRRVQRHRRRRRKRRHTLKGGSPLVLKPVPFVVDKGVPAGCGSLPIAGRHYYNLASPDLHAPYGASINTSGRVAQLGGGGLTSLLPRDVVDLGRSITGGVKGFYDEWVGQPPYISDDANVMDQNLSPGKMDTSIIDIPSIQQRSDKLAAAVQ